MVEEEQPENIRVNPETNTAHVVKLSIGFGWHQCHCGWICRSAAIPDGGELKDVKWCETCQKVIDGEWAYGPMVE